MKKHTIRIVGGEYRRTRIPVPDIDGLRPTPDRVRETLFNWLHHFWSGNFESRRVLDLFAGTGALGFEAASRGVEHVQMVEYNIQAVAGLRQMRERLKADNVRIHAGDAFQALSRMRAQPFDLVLVDPPFGHDLLSRVWSRLPPVLGPDSLIYVESEAAVNPPPPFTILRQSKAGHVHFYLLGFDALQKTDNNSEVTD